MTKVTLEATRAVTSGIWAELAAVRKLAPNARDPHCRPCMDTPELDAALWDAYLRRADAAEALLAGGHTGVDGRGRALLAMADGTRPLRALAAWLGLTRAEALEIAEPLLIQGLMEIALSPPPDAERARDPLPAHMRAAVRALRPVVARYLGAAAAETLEAEARRCGGESELLMRMRARLAGPRERDAFTEEAAAVLAESREPAQA